MPALKHFERLKHIDFLIRTKGGCSIKIVSKKLKLGRSTVLLYLAEMKKLGFPIQYSAKEKCYHYGIKGKMTEHLFEREII